jgi:hypothetical protein
VDWNSILLDEQSPLVIGYRHNDRGRGSIGAISIFPVTFLDESEEFASAKDAFGSLVQRISALNLAILQKA